MRIDWEDPAVAQIREMRARDIPIDEIAEAFGKSRHWVMNRLSPPKRHLFGIVVGPVSADESARMRDLRAAGCTLLEVALLTKRSLVTVCRHTGAPAGRPSSPIPANVLTNETEALHGRTYDNYPVRQGDPVKAVNNALKLTRVSRSRYIDQDEDVTQAESNSERR